MLDSWLEVEDDVRWWEECTRLLDACGRDGGEIGEVVLVLGVRLFHILCGSWRERKLDLERRNDGESEKGELGEWCLLSQRVPSLLCWLGSRAC